MIHIPSAAQRSGLERLHSPASLVVHADLPLHNILVDQKRQNVAILDWDTARAGTAAQQLSRLYASWSTWRFPSAERVMATFQQLMNGYEPDTVKREIMTQQILEQAFLELYAEVRYFPNWFLGTAEDAPNPTSEGLSERQRWFPHRIRAIREHVFSHG